MREVNNLTDWISWALEDVEDIAPFKWAVQQNADAFLLFWLTGVYGEAEALIKYMPYKNGEKLALAGILEELAKDDDEDGVLKESGVLDSFFNALGYSPQKVSALENVLSGTADPIVMVLLAALKPHMQGSDDIADVEETE